MILRTQKACGLSAYNFFQCDLPTFFKVPIQCLYRTTNTKGTNFTDHVQRIFDGSISAEHDMSTHKDYTRTRYQHWKWEKYKISLFKIQTNILCRKSHGSHTFKWEGIYSINPLKLVNQICILRCKNCFFYIYELFGKKY